MDFHTSGKKVKHQKIIKILQKCSSLQMRCASIPHRQETNGIAERTVRRVRKNTSSILRTAVGRTYGKFLLFTQCSGLIIRWENSTCEHYTSVDPASCHMLVLTCLQSAYRCAPAPDHDDCCPWSKSLKEAHANVARTLSLPSSHHTNGDLQNSSVGQLYHSERTSNISKRPGEAPSVRQARTLKLLLKRPRSVCARKLEKRLTRSRR